MLRCKSAIEALQNKDQIFRLILSKWEQLEEIEKFLKIAHDFTILLQKQNCTMSDFFVHWLRCELLLKNATFTKTNLASTLLDALEQRKPPLFSNNALICSVYLDPRIRSQLNNEQIAIAKKTVLDTWDKITNINEESVEHNISAENLNGSDNDILEKHLRDANINNENNLQQNMNSPQNTNNTQHHIEIILREITEYEKEKRLPTNNSVLKFWEDKKEKYPYLFKVSVVIQAVPPTQYAQYAYPLNVRAR